MAQNTLAKTIIEKQIVLLTAISSLSNAASIVENEELVIHAKNPTNNALEPIAHASLQADILTESLCTEIRGSILELMDNKINQLAALGLTINEEALAELQSTSPTVATTAG